MFLATDISQQRVAQLLSSKGVRTLILSVAALDLLMHVLLYLTLEDPGSRRLVEACSLQDVCRVDPVIVAPAHDMFLKVGSELELPHWYLDNSIVSDRSLEHREP